MRGDGKFIVGGNWKCVGVTADMAAGFYRRRCGAAAAGHGRRMRAAARGKRAAWRGAARRTLDRARRLRLGGVGAAAPRRVVRLGAARASPTLPRAEPRRSRTPAHSRAHGGWRAR
jgi:hypothetical protein